MFETTSEDARIFEVVALPHHVNVTTNSKLMKYEGTPFVMFNETSNCALGITKKKSKHYENCTRQDFLDERLNKWASVDPSEFDTLSLPNVVKTPVESIIQCWNYDISVYNRTVPCPMYPFRLSITEPFSVVNVNHAIKFATVESSNRHDTISAPFLDYPGSENDLVREVTAIRSAQAASNKRTAMISLDEGYVSIPFTYLSGILLILGSGFCLIFSCLTRSGRNAASRAGDRIEIYNSIPPPNTSQPVAQIPVKAVYQVPMPRHKRPVQMSSRGNEGFTLTPAPFAFPAPPSEYGLPNDQSWYPKEALYETPTS